MTGLATGIWEYTIVFFGAIRDRFQKFLLAYIRLGNLSYQLDLIRLISGANDNHTY